MNKEIPTVLGLRYGPKDIEDLYKVIELANKNSLSKSETGKRLVNRGLTHTDNPEPIVKTVKEVVEKIVPKDRYPCCKDCPGKPNVDKSTPHIEEHVSIDEPITDGHIQGDLQNTGQRASADKLTTRDKADPPSSSSKALKEKKSASEENGISGWKIAGGLGIAGLIGLIGYKIWQVYH